MIRNDKVKGTPLVQYKDTKTNIEALSGIEEGAIAYATDTNEFGSYDGTTWTWGQSGSFDLAAAIHAATEDTSLSNDDEWGIWESVSGLLRKIKWSTIVSGLGAYFVSHSSSTAANDFLVGSGTGAWIKKTLAQTITILQSSLDSIYAANTHTHSGSDITSGTVGAARLGSGTADVDRVLHGDNTWDYLKVGSYTPTSYNTTNITSATAYQANYIRIGNLCMVYGLVDVDPTAAVQTVLGLSLPIASAFTTGAQAGGSGYGGPTEPIRISADATNHRVSLVWTAAQLVNHTISYNYLYEII